MKLLSRGFLPLLLLVSSLQAGTLDIARNQVLTEPGNPLLEHALSDYHHYYPTSPDIKMFELSIDPFYRHLSTIDGDQNAQFGGAFARAQFNAGNFWLRLSTQFGHVQESNPRNPALSSTGSTKSASSLDSTASTNKKEGNDRSTFGIDDIILKAGYDCFFNGDDHIGLYAVGVIPTDTGLGSRVITKHGHMVKEGRHGTLEKIQVDTPVWGSKHYRAGVGVNGAFTLYRDDLQHLAFLFDAQYRHAFKADYGNDLDKNTSTDKSNKKSKTPDAIMRFTPGHTVLGWSALHYAYDCYNIELGSVFGTTFGDSASFESTALVPFNDKKEDSANNHSSSIRPLETVAFSAQPYLALSYNTLLGECPATIGIGAAYDFNKLHTSGKPNSYQGATAWVNASISF